MSEGARLFLRFSKEQPVSAQIVIPNDLTVEKSKDETILKSLDDYVEQVFASESSSRTIINKTEWAVLERPFDLIPMKNGVKDVMAYHWMLGHYDWGTLVEKVVDLRNSSGLKICIYLIPTLAQSLQGSDREDLTYNAYLAPVDQPPFSYLIQRLPSQEETLDEELSAKGDPCSYVELEKLSLEWREITTFTKQDFEILEEETIDVRMLRPKDSFKSRLPKFMNETAEFEKWYDTAMSNFLPFIPEVMADDMTHKKLPEVLLEPIECTPPTYRRLIEIITVINDAFTRSTFGSREKVRPIKEVIKFWEISPIDINAAVTEFLNSGGIPKSSKAFNALFFQQYGLTRSFIIDNILDGYLRIKREGEFEEMGGYPIEIDDEMSRWDGKIEFLFSKHPEKKKWIEIFSEFRQEILKWFGTDNARERYNEFKVTITAALEKFLATAPVKEYLKLAKKENSDLVRRKWLDLYYSKSALYCLWPTIYHVVDFPEKEKRNPLLVKTETELMKHMHMSLPTSKGQVLPFIK